MTVELLHCRTLRAGACVGDWQSAPTLYWPEADPAVGLLADGVCVYVPQATRGTTRSMGEQRYTDLSQTFEKGVRSKALVQHIGSSS